MALILAVTVVVGLPGAASALWLATTTAPPVSLAAGTVPVPAGITCTTQTSTSSALVSWQAVPGATGYIVSASNQSGTTTGTVATVTTTSITLTAGLLNGVIGSILDLLLGGQPVYIRVQTVHASGWTSQPSESVAIRRSGLVPGLLGGLRCA